MSKFSALNTSNMCIYHADDDGFGAAWVCREYLMVGLSQGFGAHGTVPMDQLGCEFVPTNYGLGRPDVTGKNVAIVDFSYKRDEMREICRQAESVIVLDHHKTAEAELDGLQDEFGNNVVIKFEEGKSGVLMAWEHFFPVSAFERKMPVLIDYLDAGDLWQLDRYDDLKQVQAALRSYPYDFEQWDQWMTPAGLDQLRSEGGAIRRFIEQKVDEIIKTQHSIAIDGQNVQAVNAPWFLASEVAGSLAEQPDSSGWGVCYYNNYDGKTFSLRSRGDVDVSEIAKKLGGGGHAGAAGFRVPRV